MSFETRKDIELEEAIIATLIHEDNIDLIPNDFNPLHFYGSRNRMFAGAILEAAQNGIDILGELISDETKNKFGYSTEDFMHFQNKELSSQVVLRYSELISLFNVRVRLGEIRKEERKLLSKSEDIPEEFSHKNDLEDIITRPKDLAERCFSIWQNLTPIKFRFKNLNSKIFSFNTGEQMIIGGRSGTAKTAFGIQIMDSICEFQQEKGIFVSTEMSSSSLLKRFFDIKYYQKNPRHTLEENAKAFWKYKNNFQTAINSVYQNITIVNISSPSIKKVREVVEYLKSEDPSYKNVCIDFLQNMKREKTSEVESIATSAYGGKEIALDYDVRTILLSQTARGDRHGGGTDGTSEFSMNHLKGSGAIEESADFVLGLWKDGEDQNKLYCKIAKDRINGSSGIVELAKYGVYLTDYNQY